MSVLKSLLLGAATLTVGALATAPVLAATATSSAFGVFVDLNVDPPIFPSASLDLGPVGSVSGAAPPDFANSGGVASIDADFSIVSSVPLDVDANLSTGVIVTNASGSITPPAFASSDSTINGFSFTFVADPLIGPDVLVGSILATTIQSSADVSGTFGALTRTGDTTIEGLAIDGVLGTLLANLGLDLSLAVNAAPNTLLLDVAGVQVIVNEQILAGNLSNTAGITTNALRVSFDTFTADGFGLLDGDIILAQSVAFIEVDQVVDPVPAPAALALFGLGLVGLGAARARRRA